MNHDTSVLVVAWSEQPFEQLGIDDLCRDGDFAKAAEVFRQAALDSERRFAQAHMDPECSSDGALAAWAASIEWQAAVEALWLLRKSRRSAPAAALR